MSLQTRIAALITAIGADIKDIRSKAALYGAFKVGLNQAATITTTSTNVAIPYNDETNFGGFDHDNLFSTTTSRYTPGRAGYYRFSYNLRLTVAAEVNAIWVGLYRNGTQIAIHGPWPTGNVANPGNGGTFPPILMNGTTDYVEIRAWTTTGSRGLSVDASTNWFAGHYIGT